MGRLHLFLVALPIIMVSIACAIGLGRTPSLRISPMEAEAIGYHFDDLLRAETGVPVQRKIDADIAGPFGRVGSMPVKVERVDDGLRLTFILVGDEERVAILNDNIVRPGQRVGNRVVESIERERIALSENGVKQWIYLQK